MLSRVADSVYWMSRYVERAENVARFIDVNNNLTLGAGEALANQWSPLIYTTGDHECFAEHYDTVNRDSVLQFLAFDRKNPNSILSCLAAARENARTIRDVISSAMWEELNTFFCTLREAAKNPSALNDLHAFCEQVKRASHLLIGVTDATMSHGEAWHFARMGRLLERADKTSRIVDVQYFILLPKPQDVGSPLDVVRWSALLKSATALEMYRRRHGRILPETVADFLILDRHFPRSARFCLVGAHESLQEITGNHQGTFDTLVEQRLGRLRADLDYTSITDVFDRGVHEFIDSFQQHLNAVGSAIQDEFFVRKAPTTETAAPVDRRASQQTAMMA